MSLVATLTEPERVSMATVAVVLYVAEPLVRDVLERAADSRADIELVATATHFDDLERIVGSSSYEQVVVLAWTGGDPIRFVAQFSASAIGARSEMVLVAPAATEALVRAAVDAGIAGFLTTESAPAEMFDAVGSVAAGNAPYVPSATRWLVAEARRHMIAGTLTAREQDVLELLADGMVNKQIARALGISESTVKVHLGHIYQRLGVDNRSRAAIWARSYGYGRGPSDVGRR